MDGTLIDWSLPLVPGETAVPIEVRLRTVAGAEHHAIEALGVLEPLQQKYPLAGVARIHAVYCVFRHNRPRAIWRLSAAGPANLSKAQAMVATYQGICKVASTKTPAEIEKAIPFANPARCMVDDCQGHDAQGQVCRHVRVCPICPMRGLQVQSSQRANRCVGHELLRCSHCKGPLWCGRIDARFRLGGRFECDKCMATLCSLCKRADQCGDCQSMQVAPQMSFNQRIQQRVQQSVRLSVQQHAKPFAFAPFAPAFAPSFAAQPFVASAASAAVPFAAAAPTSASLL